MVVVSMPQLGAVLYGVVIVAGIVALALLLAARVRRRDRRERDELRMHIRRLGGPFDPGV
jgi:predicted lysophospholipase L1 biosynthesis ABC-type transport system permease subunit